jgi:hypothetical protein
VSKSSYAPVSLPSPPSHPPDHGPLLTGIYQPGLFRKLPNRKRHQELVQLYNTPPSFGAHVSLAGEATADVCALLATYLTRLPGPLFPPPLFHALWAWCIKPTVRRELAQREADAHEDEDGRRPGSASGARAGSGSGGATTDAGTCAAEERQVQIAVLLFRLVPAARLSLLVYLLTFFSQVPLSPENGVGVEDLARLFGHRVLGGSCGLAAKSGTGWLLTRWPRIAAGLGVDDECCEKKGGEG